MYYIYIIKTEKGILYTGYTSNLERRIKEHQDKHGGWYTKCNNIEELLYCEQYNTRLEAMKRKIQIKNWSRLKKLALIKGDMEELKRLSKKRK